MLKDLVERTMLETKKLIGEGAELKRMSHYSFRISGHYKGKEITAKVSYRYRDFVGSWTGEGGIQFENASCVQIYVKMTKNQLDKFGTSFARFSIPSMIKRIFKELPIFTIEKGGYFCLTAMPFIFTYPKIELITKTIEKAIEISNANLEDVKKELVWSDGHLGNVRAQLNTFLRFLIIIYICGTIATILLVKNESRSFYFIIKVLPPLSILIALILSSVFFNKKK